jgi:hypothetical protein
MKQRQTEPRAWAKRDKDGDEIYWGECIACGERTHYKVKNVTEREMIPGETYYYMHRECRHKWKGMEEERGEM